MHRKLWTKESVQKSKRVSNLCKSTDTILCHVIFLDIYFMRIHHGWCNLSGTRVLSLCCSFLRLINNEKKTNKTGYCPLPHHCCTTVMHWHTKTPQQYFKMTGSRFCKLRCKQIGYCTLVCTWVCTKGVANLSQSAPVQYFQKLHF